MNKVVKIYNRAVIVSILFILLFVGMFTVPRLFRIVPFVVESGSMEPAIPTGSVVFVNESDTDIEVGDVVTFGLSTGRQKGVYVTHRVNRMFEEENLIQTKGDANETPDGYLSMDAVLGTAIFKIPKIGFLLDYLQKSHGYAKLIIITCALSASSVLLGEISQHISRNAGSHKNKKRKECVK